MQALRLLIINGDRAVRRCLAFLFASREGFNLLGEFDSAADTERIRSLQPDVILFWAGAGDEKNIPLISKVKKVCPYTLVVVFSEVFDGAHVAAAFTAGADGYLKTPVLPSDLVAAVELACSGRVCIFPQAIKEILINPGNLFKKGAGNGEKN